MAAKKKGDEVGAMGAVDEALSALASDEKLRVLKWAWEKFGGGAPTPGRPSGGAPQGGSGSAGSRAAAASIPPATSDETLGEFYSRASADTEAERALVVAYWIQDVRGDGEFDSQSVNKELKHLGDGVSNITRAFDDLKGRKPQLVIQTQKSGKTKQARKRYKVTAAGKQEVMRLLSGEASE